MIVTFAWPTSAQFGGGVATMFEYANALARLGHTIHLIHGPRTDDRIDHVSEIDWFTFEDSVQHHVVDRLADADIDQSDVCFPYGAPKHLGQPAVLIQGYKMIAASRERQAFRAPCPKVCVASWLEDIGVAWGSPRHEMFHVPPGIDLDRFRRPSGPAERTADVAMLYSIHPVKGGDDGMDALVELQRRRPGLRAELFGIYRPEGTLPDWATYHEAPSQDHLVRHIYQGAKVFLQPSRREGLGLTSLEAMACGSALVTTDNGGSRDYAHHGHTALVVPARDPGAMADAVGDLLEDDERRVRLAEAGAAEARQFTWERAGQALEAHLLRYVADPGRYQHDPVDAPVFLADTW